jgi:hypothetical protein
VRLLVVLISLIWCAHPVPLAFAVEESPSVPSETTPDSDVLPLAKISGRTDGSVIPIAEPIAVPVTPPPPPKGTCLVPFFSQIDPQWQTHPLRTARPNRCTADCGTIGACGCTLTSAAMILSFYGQAVDPQLLSDRLGTAACMFQWERSVLQSDGKVTNFTKMDFSWEQLDTELNQNRRPVMLEMHRMCPGRNDIVCKTHWVVVLSGHGDDPANYIINDPGRRDGARRRLNSYLGTRWEPVSLTVYDGQSPCSLTAATAALNAPLQAAPVVVDPVSPISDTAALTITNTLEATTLITGTALVYDTTDVTMTLDLDAQSSAGAVTEMLIWTDTLPSDTWQPFSRYVAVPRSERTYVQFRDAGGSTSDRIVAYASQSPDALQLSSTCVFGESCVPE